MSAHRNEFFDDETKTKKIWLIGHSRCYVSVIIDGMKPLRPVSADSHWSCMQIICNCFFSSCAYEIAIHLHSPVDLMKWHLDYHFSLDIAANVNWTCLELSYYHYVPLWVHVTRFLLSVQREALANVNWRVVLRLVRLIVRHQYTVTIIILDSSWNALSLSTITHDAKGNSLTQTAHMWGSWIHL